MFTSTDYSPVVPAPALVAPSLSTSCPSLTSASAPCVTSLASSSALTCSSVSSGGCGGYGAECHGYYYHPQLYTPRPHHLISYTSCKSFSTPHHSGCVCVCMFKTIRIGVVRQCMRGVSRSVSRRQSPQPPPPALHWHFVLICGESRVRHASSSRLRVTVSSFLDNLTSMDQKQSSYPLFRIFPFSKDILCNVVTVSQMFKLTTSNTSLTCISAICIPPFMPFPLISPHLFTSFSPS